MTNLVAKVATITTAAPIRTAVTGSLMTMENAVVTLAKTEMSSAALATVTETGSESAGMTAIATMTTSLMDSRERVISLVLLQTLLIRGFMKVQLMKSMFLDRSRDRSVITRTREAMVREEAVDTVAEEVLMATEEENSTAEQMTVRIKRLLQVRPKSPAANSGREETGMKVEEGEEEEEEEEAGAEEEDAVATVIVATEKADMAVLLRGGKPILRSRGSKSDSMKCINFEALHLSPRGLIS